VVPDSIVYSDSWRGYNALDVSDFKHFRIHHSELFADPKNHINGTKKSGICENSTVIHKLNYRN